MGVDDWIVADSDMHVIGHDNLVFSTDFPHGDSQYPHAFESIRKLPIPEERQRRIVGENWSRLYGIPLAKRATRA